MKNITYFRNLFVRQDGPNDCGIACLSMVLNYAGRPGDSDTLRSQHAFAPRSLSLLELRKLAAGCELAAQCVLMGIDTLRKQDRPCILHMENESGEQHFQVCFGTRRIGGRYRYLMADPARQIYYLDEAGLIELWKSKAALYFPGLLPGLPAAGPAFKLLSFHLSIPGALLVVVPLLHIGSCFMGIAITWVLQTGMQNSFSGEKTSLLVALAALLLLINISRSALAFIRQKLLMMVNRHVNDQLTDRLLNDIKNYKEQNLPKASYPLKRAMTDIQRFQNAVFVLINVLMADGSLLLLVISSLTYYQPVIGCVNLVYLLIALLVTVIKLPSLDFDHAHLAEMAAIAESQLLKEISRPIPFDLQQSNTYRRDHARYQTFAKMLAGKISKLNLFCECAGSLNVVIVLIISLLKLKQSGLSYGPFLILVLSSLFLSTLIPRICNSLITIRDGLSAANDNKFIGEIN